MTPTQKAKVKKLIIDEIGEWSGTLYHGSHLVGVKCILENGFAADESMATIGLPLFSTSKNNRMLEYFGRDDNGAANGFRFKVKFNRVWMISEFWFALLYLWSEGGGADIWYDDVEDHPEFEDVAVDLFGPNYGDAYAGSGERFYREFVPKGVQAIAFPDFFTASATNAEAEMAITPVGVKMLKEFTDAIIIDYGEYSWEGAKEMMSELGIEGDCDYGE